MASEPEPDKVMPIAVVGMACRFPGDGENVESLFEMLKKGDSAYSDFPSDRVNIDGFFHPSGNRQGSIGFRGAHFLKGDIKAFDAAFFNISQTEAQAIDPQQRLLLEVTYQALENAGISKESLDLSETSVNVGTFVKDYEQVVLRDPDWAPQYAATGTGNAILANRISYQFNLRGPSQTIDTGCSASLVSVHNGCQDLRTGRADLAIAAGVGLILTPATMMPMTALNFLGGDGKCYTFTNKAQGYGRGEGVGVVILKRLDDALRDNDTIRAVIRGTRVNQDGRTPGITMPSAASQLSNIKAVYNDAGLTVDQTAFVECHGTGTPAGDPKESFAVSGAFCADRAADNPILIGSIKPNVGHLEGAAGVAGLIKAVMAVERGQIPKNLYFEPSIGNPDIKFQEWKVKVPTQLTPWPMDGLRRASVNCFGFGGTNAHIILDDAGTYLSQRALNGNHQSVPTSACADVKEQKTFANTQLFVISSHEHDGIARVAEGHAPYVLAHGSDRNILADYAYTMSRRSTLEYKTCIVAQSPSDLAAKLAAADKLKVHRFTADDSTTPKLSMVFCGQGAQWHAMGRELMEFEPFYSSLTGASGFLSRITDGTFDVLAELQHQDPAKSCINEPEFAQPATTAVQVALIDLLKAAGISPEAVVGHSSGEIAAAYAAGFITRENAWYIAYQRGQCAAMIKRKFPEVKGRMIAVALSASEAQRYISAVAEGTVVVACENSPVSTTLSGDEEQILQIAHKIANDGVWYRLLAVNTAYHSHHMKLIEDEYLQSLRGIGPAKEGSGPQMFSSITGDLIDQSRINATYWSTNLVSTVLFNQAFSALYKAIKPKILIEISPAVTLNRPVQDIVKAINPKRKHELSCIPLLKRDYHASSTALEALGEIWSRGIPVDLSCIWKSKEGYLPQLLVDLPPYPFNRSKPYWFESHLGTALRFRTHGREDLIGGPVAESTPQEPRWRGFFRLEENPWLTDHQVQKATIYPAAGILTMALEAARQSSDPSLLVDVYQISNFNIIKPVIIPAGQHGLEHTLNAKVLKLPSPDATHCSTVFSFSMMTRTEHGHWQEHANGIFTIFYRGKATDMPDEDMACDGDFQSVYQRLRSECTQSISPRQLYERLDGIGMNYGPVFQNIVALSKCQHACTSIVRIPDTKSKMPAQFEFDHLIHPATLDAMFQTVFAVGDTTMVPSYIRQITFSPDMLRGAGAEFQGYATAHLKGFREAQADIIMSDKNFSKPMVAVKGMQFVKISSDASGFLPSNRHLCSEIIWKELGPVPTYQNGALGVNEGKPTILLLPDGKVSDATDILLRHLDFSNLEPVKVSQLTEQHMSELCIALVEADECLVFNMHQETFDLVKKLLITTPGLLWVTTEAQQTIERPDTAPFSGLARSVRSEDSSRRIITLDLGKIQSQGEAALSASAIQDVFTRSFVNDDINEIPEVEYSLRDRKLFGVRLSPLSMLNTVIEKGEDEAVQIKNCLLGQVEEPLSVKVGHVTDIRSTYFVVDEASQRSLGPDEVLIAVESTHLFPIDLETIMGRSSESVLGADVIGTVTETGSNIQDLPEGSLVVALARSTIKSSVILNRAFVHQLQDRSMVWGMSPTALVTAYHGLNTIGCISRGDTVFINRARGPYGDAVLRLCKLLDATIFVGVSAAEERHFIQENYGIEAERIVDTTNDRFPEKIMRLTAGTGVDFFFSPTPDDLEQSSQCVAANGHLFLILNTNATVSKTAVIPQHSNISLHKFDLFALIEKRPNVFAKAWAEVLELQLSGQLGTCPVSLVVEERIEHLDHLWENMSAAPGRHMNTVTFTDNSVIRVGMGLLKPLSLDANATYVLVGGLGGLGKAVAKLMIDRGARHLIFLSRSGAKSRHDQDFLRSISQGGVIAKASRVDICKWSELRSALIMIQRGMPAIKGVVQCAAVIADSVWETMTYDDWKSATDPKMKGSWNLHQVLPRDMDFFIFLSSASGVIGNRGQANYAAGNCYQDALARYRTSQGMHSVSIDLGPVMGAGMLENDNKTLAILKASGFLMVMLEDFLFLVEHAMCGSQDSLRMPPQVVTGVGTGGLILQNEVSDPYWTETKMFQILSQVDLPQILADSRGTTPSQSFSSSSSQSSGRGLVQALKQADNIDEATDTMLGGCVNYLSVSLSMNPDDMDVEKSLTAYGVDSLVTSSFRSWIFKNVGVKITDMEVIGAASIEELARSITEKGGWGA